MKAIAALAGGFTGTLTVAAIHESLRRVTPNAPRMDLLNIELIRKGLKSLNKEVPVQDQLQQWAVGGELFSDTAYYSLAGIGGEQGVLVRGALLGLAAGVSAVVLPKPLGLSPEFSNKTNGTKLMTIGIYLAAGLAAAVITQLVETAQRDAKKRKQLL